MSLRVTHGCFQGSYSTFAEWRNTIATVCGYNLQEVGMFIGGSLVTTMAPALNWNRLPKETEYGEWRKTPADPLIVLLAHSDCEGVIHPEQGIALANRLEQIIDRLPEQYIQEPTGEFWFDLNPIRGTNYKGITRIFIDGLRLAASGGEDVEFF